MEKVKARFLKAALGLSKFTPSRLVYELARETFLIEDNRLRYLLAPTKASTKLLEQRKQKREHIWEDFYVTEAMMTTARRQANFELRHILTRFTVHGLLSYLLSS